MAVTAKIRKLVAERARYCCEYCLSQLKFSPASFALEHIIPQSQNADDSPDNLAYACYGCNSHKFTATHAIDPSSGETVRLYHPRHDDWQTHFKWREDKLIMIGLTPIGRATIARLRLNRAGVVNLRRMLVVHERHPPT